MVLCEDKTVDQRAASFYTAIPGWLTRVRVARQVAFSASQCCRGSCKRNAVIILMNERARDTFICGFFLTPGHKAMKCDLLFVSPDSPGVSSSAASVGHHSHTPEAEVQRKVCQ